MSKGQKQLQTTATNRSAEQYQAGTAASQRLQDNPEIAHAERWSKSVAVISTAARSVTLRTLSVTVLR
jgi:hypothetical protein